MRRGEYDPLDDAVWINNYFSLDFKKTLKVLGYYKLGENWKNIVWEKILEYNTLYRMVTRAKQLDSPFMLSFFKEFHSEIKQYLEADTIKNVGEKAYGYSSFFRFSTS